MLEQVDVMYRFHVFDGLLDWVRWSRGQEVFIEVDASRLHLGPESFHLDCA